jgi:ADP-ribosyl-[dinitrogen reductase] hydrolase
MKFYRTGQLMAASTGKRSDGNGSLMRLAPVAIVHHDNIEETQRIARAQSFTTHASTKAADCCELLGMLLHHIFTGLSLPQALDVIQNHNAVQSWNTEVQDIASGTWQNKTREEISSIGYVVHTLEAAIWSVYHTRSFEDALILAVNLGHDADTVGAVTGQIAGALYGLDAIPKRWINTLVKPDMLAYCAEGLINR